MTRGKAEDAGGLTPAKDDNAAPYHFDRRSLPIFKCVDYISDMNRKSCWYRGKPSPSACGRRLAPLNGTIPMPPPTEQSI